jgi:Flp pilus assembly protein CpaB
MGKYGLLLGCFVLFSSVFGFVHWMKRYEVKVTTEPVLMAKRYIPAHTVITEEMLYMEQIDSRLKNTNAIHDPKFLIGKETSIPIGTNEQLVNWKIDERRLIPNPGESYFTFKTDAISSVSNMVRRGDYVPIWLEVDESTLQSWSAADNQGSVPGALLVIDQAKVAYVKDAQGQEVVDQGSNKVEQFFYGKSDHYDQVDHEQFRAIASADTVSVTYILTDRQYERLVRAQRFGKLKMGLSWQFQTILDQKRHVTAMNERNDYDFEFWVKKAGLSSIKEEEVTNP